MFRDFVTISYIQFYFSIICYLKKKEIKKTLANFLELLSNSRRACHLTFYIILEVHIKC